jgi:hypothetical protein
MEKPYQGRAIVEDGPAFIKITIPVKRNFFAFFFIGFLLLNWGVGLAVICFELKQVAAEPFILLPFGIMLIPYVFVFRAFWLILRGKEIVEVGDGIIHVKKPSLFFQKAKTYDLKECINFRIQESVPYAYGPMRTAFTPLIYSNTGLIVFDYGMKDVKLGNGIDAAEARYILNLLNSRFVLVPLG